MKSSDADLSRALSLVEATLEATDNGILVVDTTGRITHTNTRFITMWRIPPELLASHDDQLLLQHVVDQLTDPQQFIDKVRSLYERPQATSRDTLHFRDGRVFARFSHPQRIGSDIVGRVWSFLDITEQHNSEQRVLQLSQAISDELERSERERQQLRALLAAIPDLVWMKDSAGRFLSCNPAFALMMNAQVDQIIGRTDYDFFPKEVADRFREDDRQAAERSAPIVLQEWIKHLNDGHQGLLETIKTAVRSSDGQPIGILGIARDITRTHNLLVELGQARAEAQQSSLAKGNFLANMSHEIRTPMNAIIGMADLCLGTPLNERQRNYVEKIKSASDALLRIINDILDFSKIEAGKLDMESIPFVLETVFEQLSGIVALRAANQGIELSYEIDDDSRLLLGDPLRLGQILINLVSNALKFSAGGNVVVRVTHRTITADACELQFSISDEGIGMSAEQLDQLFQPFHQADASTTRRYGGTGLGLAISRHLVQMMGGRIWAESEPERGSTFHFTARFRTSGPDRRYSGTELAHRLRNVIDHPVLVVDDSAVARSVLKQLLEKLGLTVHIASSGTAALDLVANHADKSYLACFVDWYMPEIDGIETIRRLRQTLAERQPTLPPMILITAFSHHDELRNIGHEIDGFLAKPLCVRHLYAELARCLGLVTGLPSHSERRRNKALQWTRFHGLDILLVEDVEINQEVITEMLATEGLRVRLAKNGVEALDACSLKVPDLILMDCQMPVMDGFTATARLRANPATSSVPIIALTANAFASDQKKCLDAGMTAHIAKPVHMDELYECMVRSLPTTGTPTAPAGAPPQTLPAIELPVFPGIDPASSLAHVGGRPLLLLRVLKQFRDNQGRVFAEQFAAAEALGDRTTQTRLAHSLKGVANTLGAMQLGAAAHALQEACEADDGEACAHHLSATLAQLNSVLQGLQDIDALLERATQTSAPKEKKS